VETQSGEKQTDEKQTEGKQTEEVTISLEDKDVTGKGEKQKDSLNMQTS
jgi:hypothetical protein